VKYPRAFLTIVLFVFNPVDKFVGYSTEIRSFRDVLPNESLVFSCLHASKNGTAYKSRKKFVIPLLFPDVLQILFHYQSLLYVSNPLWASSLQLISAEALPELSITLTPFMKHVKGIFLSNNLILSKTDNSRCIH